MKKVELIEKDEHIQEHSDELQKILSESTASEIINPEVYKYLNAVETKQLKRWVNQFIKANIIQAEKLAVPFMNKKLKRRLEIISFVLKKQEYKRVAQAMKDEKDKIAGVEHGK